MRYIFVLLIFFIPYSNKIFCQNNIEIEISEGFVFFDYFSENYPSKYEKIFSGYGLKTDLTIWKNIINLKTINLKAGVGYTNYYYLNSNSILFFAQNENSTNYMNLKFGLDFKPNWSPITFLLKHSNYFYLFNEKQRYSQNVWFSTIDLGFRVNLKSNIQLSLSTPITISPIDNGKFILRPFDFDIDINPWIEITGINLGISYGFGIKN